ncbi:DUF4124 domain-containing protein [Neisseria sp.]|uniref:DUF4124 domain-containing protein n=1 Tax=Neisseria sp. TaxID=192066 RepID=UPI0035A089B0
MHTPKLLALAALLLTAHLPAADVYTWKNSRGGNSYSDAPRNLQPARSSTVNIRTHSVTKPAAPAVETPSSEGGNTLAEQQQALSKKIADENKKIEEQNKKIEEQNRQQKAENCQTARLNRQAAETARNNREALIKRFDADVGKYCN